MLELSETLIQRYCSSESFRRGQHYYGQGAIVSAAHRGCVLEAEVAGSDFAPYNVRVSFDEAGITDAACSCPYDWGGWCKHIVAVLLLYVHEPESVGELPALEDTLSELGRDQLQNLLLKLAERDPSVAGVIEGELSLSTSSKSPLVNAEAIRRRLHYSIRSSPYMQPYEDYWPPGGELDEVRRVMEGAWDFIRADDGQNALPVLEAITEEYLESLEVEDWEMLGDYGGELVEFFEEVGAAFAEALLSEELTAKEKEDYSANLDVWRGELREYVAEEYFGAAFRAVEQGWFYPPLVRVLEGGLPDDEFFEEIFDDPLTVARLNVLERRGRHEEYLNLSEAADEPTAHATMLARMGRSEDTVEYALERLADPEEALAVAETLREQGRPEAALRVGEYGLSLDGRKIRLAGWVRDLAEGLGRSELALEAAMVAFRADPGLATYRRVGKLAGEHWPEYRERLLNQLRQSTSYLPTGHVEVFLHEGLIGDAIAAVDRYPVGSLVAQVADAATDSHPEWVIETCCGPAKEIMDEGRSGHYEEAVDWLTKVREAYLAAGREEEWRAYLGELIERHQRKYKLRPMLEDLGR